MRMFAGDLPAYPPKGWDFPRLGIPVTPAEELFQYDRVLGRMGLTRMIRTPYTVVRQPRVETTLVEMVTELGLPPGSWEPEILISVFTAPKKLASMF